MNVDRDPRAVMKIASSEFDKDESGLHYLFTMQRNSCEGYLNNLEAEPSGDQLNTAIELVKEQCELSIQSQQIIELLTLYPKVKIQISNDDYDGVCEMLSDFLLGCRWPIHKDNLDINAFIDLLKKQAVLFGYSIDGEPVVIK